MDSVLDRLADRAGIAPEYTDALEQRQQTSAETKRSLLRAMGLPAEDEQAAEATLAALEAQDWSRALPPCAVLYAGKPATVPVTLPAGTAALQWRLQLETGQEQTGTADVSSLEAVGSHDLEGTTRERRLLTLPADLPWGYHRLHLDGVDAECSLIVSPGQCWLPESAGQGRRFWGVAAQVYLLRSERNWGIGDFSDLRTLVEVLREQGAEAVGVNPLHGMFLDTPEQCSPYSPLSRYLLNALNIDVEAIPEFARCAEAQALVDEQTFQQRLADVRAAEMVDYTNVAALKLPVLQALFADFEKDGSAERKQQFEAFCKGCDPLLTEGCLFEALREHLAAADPAMSYHGHWPAAYRNVNAEGVTRFQQEHGSLVRYQLWLQWVADEQLAAVRQACEGMAIGVYRDLAVGANPGGAEVWSNPTVMVAKAEVGCPPDIWNAAGQNWVLPPFHPLRMREDGYRSFIALLRTNMRHAGGVRIDHAMALQRLYWIPQGKSAREGGYVHYPTEDLIGVIALESHRNRCLVVGEDLGTVAPGFRERMAEAQILSYRVLLLERVGKGFTPLEDYPHLGLSTASSHDLPTLRGWWEETDLDLREQMGLTKPEDAAAKRAERDEDRRTLVELLRRERLLPEDTWPDTPAFTDAAHGFLARTSAVLMMAQLEDLVEQAEQVNMPGSRAEEYPSWSLRVAVTLEALPADSRLTRLAEIVRRERGGPTRT